ncbi:MAG: hypothetical protein CVU88_00875 [Firmicutes bacterium HGW-Firmicutes-13]|nr:MAG: hypothetical protein CVU88_00875 [Firmicutes bacterium HGW-Firmicutes-13]
MSGKELTDFSFKSLCSGLYGLVQFIVDMEREGISRYTEQIELENDKEGKKIKGLIGYTIKLGIDRKHNN